MELISSLCSACSVMLKFLRLLAISIRKTMPGLRQSRGLMSFSLRNRPPNRPPELKTVGAVAWYKPHQVNALGP